MNGKPLWSTRSGTLILGSNSTNYKCPYKDCGGYLYAPKETGGVMSVKIEKDPAGHIQVFCTSGHFWIAPSIQSVAKSKPNRRRKRKYLFF